MLPGYFEVIHEVNKLKIIKGVSELRHGGASKRFRMNICEFATFEHKSQFFIFKYFKFKNVFLNNLLTTEQFDTTYLIDAKLGPED